MQVAQSVERRDWNVYEVTDTPDVHQNLVGTFVGERAAKLRDHLFHHPVRDYGGAQAGCQRGRSGYSSRCRSIESITPITAASMGELGRPTAVIAEKPSVVSRTRSPTPASTASSASKGSPRSEPSRLSGWTTRILRPSCEGALCVATTSPMMRPISMVRNLKLRCERLSSR